MIDAPVSGGPRGANAGTVAIIVRGQTDLREINPNIFIPAMSAPVTS
jgi:3-hydroxyisobutyrate dehydrogenase-like beta-hydroxyacid dehydrogenase